MSVTIHTDGSWRADKSDYEIDESLARAIAGYLIKQECETVFDLGCGAGGYVDILAKYGLWVRGVDLNPRTKEFSERCDIYDISAPMMGFGRYHAVLCLEVDECVPPGKEQQLFDNIKYLCASTAIISWKPIYAGMEQMNMRGFIFDPVGTNDLIKAVTKESLKDSLMVFHNQRHNP